VSFSILINLSNAEYYLNLTTMFNPLSLSLNTIVLFSYAAAWKNKDVAIFLL